MAQAPRECVELIVHEGNRQRVTSLLAGLSSFLLIEPDDYETQWI